MNSWTHLTRKWNGTNEPAPSTRPACGSC
ncbi:hypothetical protein DSM3645_02658 [Blastopirellula marina DSM 3645]|uniref:Uncharacterized protein n=1 Tax=Blastopirellula marina DSM 3645 TaxID=314230 RepID=A3ZVJ5_9BACT|nr:hypothetical protein DSM3645_02658 [Blastopirellula marina DSM 3645]